MNLQISSILGVGKTFVWWELTSAILDLFDESYSMNFGSGGTGSYCYNIINYIGVHGRTWLIGKVTH